MLLNHLRELPQKNHAGESLCPECQSPLIAKCGAIVTWHWAHKHDPGNCQHEGESEWHMQWKLKFSTDWLERPYPGGRADVMLPSGDIIEFQSKGHDQETLMKRTAGIAPKRIAWVIDGREGYEAERLHLRNLNNDNGKARKYFATFRWKQHPKWLLEGVQTLLIDVDGQNLFDVRRIYIPPPTGGYGYLRPAQDFIDFCLQRQSLDFLSWTSMEVIQRDVEQS